MAPPNKHDLSQFDEDVAAFFRYVRFYASGANRRVKGILSKLFPDAQYELSGEEVDGLMTHEGRKYTVFVNIYPFLSTDQVKEDIDGIRKSSAGQRSLVLFVTTHEGAEKLATLLRDDYPTLNAGVYVWRLDLEETDHGWDWKRGEVSCNSSL